MSTTTTSITTDIQTIIAERDTKAAELDKTVEDRHASLKDVIHARAKMQNTVATVEADFAVVDTICKSNPQCSVTIQPLMAKMHAAMGALLAVANAVDVKEMLDAKPATKEELAAKEAKETEATKED